MPLKRQPRSIIFRDCCLPGMARLLRRNVFQLLELCLTGGNRYRTLIDGRGIGRNYLSMPSIFICINEHIKGFCF